LPPSDAQVLGEVDGGLLPNERGFTQRGCTVATNGGLTSRRVFDLALNYAAERKTVCQPIREEIRALAFQIADMITENRCGRPPDSGRCTGGLDKGCRRTRNRKREALTLLENAPPRHRTHIQIFGGMGLNGRFPNRALSARLPVSNAFGRHVRDTATHHLAAICYALGGIGIGHE